MNLNRILRDATMLVAFCGGFYLLTLFMSRLDGIATASESDFSEVRLRADEKFEKRDWIAAAEELSSLVEADPYNGRAWYMLASCYYSQSNRNLDLVKEINESETVDKEQLQNLESEIAELHVKAKMLFMKSQEFARYRTSSLVSLAVIECRDAEYDEAIEHLDGFIEFGGRSKLGLEKYPHFGVGGDAMTTPGSVSTPKTRLHDRPEFWAIVRKEARNRK